MDNHCQTIASPTCKRIMKESTLPPCQKDNKSLEQRINQNIRDENHNLMTTKGRSYILSSRDRQKKTENQHIQEDNLTSGQTQTTAMWISKQQKPNYAKSKGPREITNSSFNGLRLIMSVVIPTQQGKRLKKREILVTTCGCCASIFYIYLSMYGYICVCLQN